MRPFKYQGVKFMKLSFIEYVKKVYAKFAAENVTTNAAQVAFYFIFALFPLLLFLLNIIGLFLGAAEGVREELFAYLGQVVPSSAINLIQDTITEITSEGGGGKLTFGALLALWSASAGVDNIRIALNDVYDLEETRPWWKYKLVSVLLTLGIAVLIFLALGIVFYGGQFLNLLFAPLGIEITSYYILTIFSLVVVGVALVLSFALLYNFAPNHDPFDWHWITPGAITAIVLWILLSLGFRTYLHFFDSYSKTYGSVGAIIVLLLWLYLTAMVILIGGIVNSVIEKEAKGEEVKIESENEEEKEAEE
jgi:membrane protein